MPATASGSASVTARPWRALRLGSDRPLEREEMLAAPVRWPRPSRLAEPVKVEHKRIAAGLRSLGVETVGDLLEHLPATSREARTVAGLADGEQATVAVEVRTIRARPVRRRGMRPLVEARVADATGTMRATFFNQPWLVDRYPPGTRLMLHGSADGRGGFRVSHHAPGAGASAGEGDAVAHYPAAEGVTSTQILSLVQSSRAALADVPEALSAATRVSEKLPDRPTALAAMHFPRQAADVEEGRERLAFDELLLTQLAFLRRRAQRRARKGATALAEEPSLTARWLAEGLPFSLTGDQARAIEAVSTDLAQTRAMQRLLMGEVGSGKTVVALHAMLRAVEHGCQAALMAPTETLAEQHFQTVQRLLGAEPIAAALLTGSTPAARRREVLARLGSGELSLIVGTHALIEPDVRFRDLAVAVVDEQHRFGVRQREALDGGEAGSVHTLHMTATPIPRTLSLAQYGDLDTSTLRELPAGRRPIHTEIVHAEDERARAYEHLRSQLRAGRQAYVVCPLVEEDDAGAGAGAGAAAGAGRAAARAAKAEVQRLGEGELSGHRLALMHGGMPAREKQQAMAAFAAGEVEVLVATTVIEVGIDVPNATVMLIENAERFGISQLHQLRGRIGRGEHQSRCFLVGPPGAVRLRALADHADGFRLAEIDLGLRKEGELIGTRQSGVRQFEVACLPEDAPLLERARARAETIFASDPELSSPEHALLNVELQRHHPSLARPLPV